MTQSPSLVKTPPCQAPKGHPDILKGVGRERVLSRGGEVLAWWLELRKCACPVANVPHKVSCLEEKLGNQTALRENCFSEGEGPT